MTFLKKIEEAKNLIKESIEKYPKIAVGCSFGKDSMVLVHLCQEIKKDIPIFYLIDSNIIHIFKKIRLVIT